MSTVRSAKHRIGWLIGFFWFIGMSQAVAADAHIRHQASLLAHYQRQLVQQLSRSGGNDALIAAAALARTVSSTGRDNLFHQLIQRMTHDYTTPAPAWWLALSDCDVRANDCPQLHALNHLKQQVPDNAAVWMVALGQAARQRNDKAALAALTRAANSRYTDDYTGAILNVVSRYSLQLPPSGRLSQDRSLFAGPDSVRVMMVFGLARLHPLPGLQATAALCHKHRKNKKVRQQCLDLAELLVEGASPLSRSLGLHLQEKLDRHRRARNQAIQRRQDLIWQVYQFGKLLRGSYQYEPIANHLLRLAQTDQDYMTLLQQALSRSNIGLHPPKGWQAPESPVMTLPEKPVDEKTSSSHPSLCKKDVSSCVAIGSIAIPALKPDPLQGKTDYGKKNHASSPRPGRTGQSRTK